MLYVNNNVLCHVFWYVTEKNKVVKFSMKCLFNNVGLCIYDTSLLITYNNKKIKTQEKKHLPFTAWNIDVDSLYNWKYRFCRRTISYNKYISELQTWACFFSLWGHSWNSLLIIGNLFRFALFQITHFKIRITYVFKCKHLFKCCILKQTNDLMP